MTDFRERGPKRSPLPRPRIREQPRKSPSWIGFTKRHSLFFLRKQILQFSNLFIFDFKHQANK